MKRRRLTKQDGRLILYVAAVSVLVLMFCTRSSFLYPMNNWDDANSYFTMGKSMFAGKVIYRDLFDQKGPWLYFLYGLCSLFSRTTFAGVFVLEVLWGMLDVFAIIRILSLKLSRRTSLLLAPLVLAVMFSTRSFYWGGSAEEICMPALLWGLYIVLRYLFEREEQGAENRAPMAAGNVFLLGLLAGFVAGVKFTVLGFFIGTVLILMLTGGTLKSVVRLCGIFLGGMLLPFVPWFLYFGMHHALKDWYNAYIYTNVFVYSTFGAADKGEGLFEKVYHLAKILYWQARVNGLYFFFVLLGMLGFAARKGTSFITRLAPLLLFFFTFTGIYIGGAEIPYYSLPLSAFAVLGFSMLRFEIPKKAKGFALCTVLTLTLLLCSFLGPNRYYRYMDEEELFLSRFTKEIEEGGIDHPTLLNYQCLDCGLYTTADIDPTCFWFQSQTLPTIDVLKEQERFALEEGVDYIVARHDYPSSFGTKYKEIDSFHQVMGDAEYDYYLLKRR